MKCCIWNKVGHIKRNCPQLKTKNQKKCYHYCKKNLMKDCCFKRKKEKERNSREDQRAEIGHLQLTDNVWWLDSGATENLCFDIKQFVEIEERVKKRQVKVGNESP